MGNGRFGPIEQKNNEKKRYTIDYNRLITSIMVVVIVVLGIVIYRDYKAKQQAELNAFLSATTASDVNFLKTPASEATPSPEELRPLPEEEGLLPVFSRANTNEKRIAITVDGFVDADYVETLMGLCATYDVKVTLFPTGEELLKYESLWPSVVLGGHEIENHTFSDSRLSQMSAEEMKDEIKAQTNVLRSIIGEDYQPHFLRTGDMADDLNKDIHAVLIENGYFGVARFRVHTPAALSDVENGAIISYTLNERGLKALSQAIPVLYENGYQMVTVNDLFVYPGNFPDTDAAG